MTVHVGGCEGGRVGVCEGEREEEEVFNQS